VVKVTSSSRADFRLGAARRGSRRLPRPSVIDAGWAVFSLLNLMAIFWFENWETIPFHFIWISLTLLYGFRAWSSGPTLWVLGAVMVATGTGIGLDVFRGTEPCQELTEVPLMAAVFVATAWHVYRRKVAEARYRLISEENARLLLDQRHFVQDAAHQLRTPITIALGHAELLAESLARRVAAGQEAQDIQVVIGELDGLRRIAQSLLLIVAASDPQFLTPELVALDQLVTGLLARWHPAADRDWRLGRLDAVSVRADRDRLSLALDALLDNAVQHTVPGDVIEVSVVSEPGSPARLVVADAGSGIPEDQLHLIFDRFRTGRNSQSRGTGLGLVFVRAVANAHGGDVTVRSTLGQGSQFELTLPALTERAPASSAAGQQHTATGARAGQQHTSEGAEQ
jgi:signal transduction histidine kinase